MRKQKGAKTFLAYIVVFAIAIAFSFSPAIINEVFGISKACNNSPDCRAAVEKERQANQAAASAAASANLYQIRVNELAAQVARKEAEIANTEADINALNIQIAATQAKLESDQEALAELLIGVHFEGDSEPITILAGASSISDLAEKQARSEVVKKEVSVAATKVKQEKEKLEADKAKVEAMLEQQKQARNELITAKAEQQALVDKYNGDAVAYAAAAAQAKAEKLAAEKAEQEAHPELYRGSAYFGDNTYPWQGDCPGRQDEYTTYRDGYSIGGLVCECVSYVGWKAYEYFGIALSYGNAYDWAWKARSWGGFRVDNTPAENTIGQTSSGIYGHVFWVEGVNPDGSINVTEYNNSWATYLYSGNSHFGDFGARTIPANSVWQYNYIHFE